MTPEFRENAGVAARRTSFRKLCGQRPKVEYTVISHPGPEPPFAPILTSFRVVTGMDLGSTNSQPLGVRRRKRLKVKVACDSCRRRKVKCDGGRPACRNCSKRPVLQRKCLYASSTSEGPPGPSPVLDASVSIENTLLERGVGSCSAQHQQEQDVLQPRVSTDSAPHDESAKSLTPKLSDPRKDCYSSASHELFGSGDGSGSSSAFAGQINAAIDARSGEMDQPQCPTATPMVDVPLFPSSHGFADSHGLADGAGCELPPRKQADSLLQAYWSEVYHLLPVLSRPDFMHSYSLFVSETTVVTNKRIFLSTLNAIFALAVQSQESIDLNMRERLSEKYFNRAHGLLHLPLWEVGSIDLVQCLLLMSQYLQCTNKPYQTWMVAGSAVRIAQGLGLHSPELWSAPPKDDAAALKCRVWRSCIIMDRMICVSQGRPPLVSEHHVSTVIRMQQGVDSRHSKCRHLPFEDYVAGTLEVYEITNHAVQRYLSTPEPQTPNVGCFKLLDPNPMDENLGLILRTDGCLRRWQDSLPADLKYESSMYLQNDTSARQATILHLRYLHSRIILLRPMLARCCSATAPGSPADDSLSRRFMEQCALECVSVAQRMISVVSQKLRHDTSILPPWWFRVFYTYTAAMVLAVSSLRLDLFPRPEIRAAWKDALALFQAHEHLSKCVGVCKTALHSMFLRIQETQDVADSTPWLGENAPHRQDNNFSQYPLFLEDLALHLEQDSLFGLTSVSWLTEGQDLVI